MRTMSEEKARKWTRSGKGRGFTLAETLIVVALLAVIAAIAFMGVVSWRKRMRQLEYDATAKEIFVAAQNHLTLAETQGLLEETAFDLGHQDGETGEAEAGGESADISGVYYFVYGGTTGPGDTLSVLDLMLPFGSIDENVRAGGSYIIRYQPDIAAVLDVFYTEDAKLSDGDYETLVSLSGEGDNEREERQSYQTANKDNAIIGYYGGDASGYAAVKLKAPTVQVQNADTLKVVVTYPRENDNRLSRSSEVELKLVIEELEFEEIITPAGGIIDDSDPMADEGSEQIDSELEGASEGAETAAAGAKRFITLTTDNVTKTDGKNDVYEITLDDVTKSFGSSKPVSLNNRVWESNQTNNILFTPGYNFKVFAKAQSTASAEKDGKRVIAIAKSNEVETNESFAQTAKVENDVLKVEITSFRHLANLSEAVSGFTGAGHNSIEASQTTDLSWGRFIKNISKEHNEGADTYANETSIAYADGSKASEGGTFLPVNPNSEYVLVYDGLKENVGASVPTAHRISGVVIDTTGSAGIFGEFSGVTGSTPATNSTIKNLVVVNAVVEASGTNASAGALVGKLAGDATVSNVLVRTSLRAADATKGVTSSGVAGGLVGTIDGATVTNSAAAVRVKAPAGTAGGLVGSATSSTISRSYSSAHIQSDTGDYVKNELDVDAQSNSSIGVAAGGLVGSASNTQIASCYSTCAVGNASNVGGLVGSATSSSITGCYVTGLVTNPTTEDDNGEEILTGTIGTFIGNRGSGTSTTTLTSDYYYKIVNGSSIEPIGNETEDGDHPVVSPFDVMTNSNDSWSASPALSEYFPTNSPAVPYNQELAKRYSGKYAFKTIDTSASDPTAFTDHLTRHYGDWPSYEVFVVNNE